MKKIKVLHFYKCAYPESIGGIEKFVNDLCKSGVSFGIQNTVMAFSRTNKNIKTINIASYKVILIPETFTLFSTSFSFSAFKKFKELVSKADIIHYHFPYPFSDILHFFCRVRKPSIITYHSDIVRQKRLMFLYILLMNLFLNSVNHIVATSPNYLSTSNILKRFSSKVSVIPIGLNFADYPSINREIHSFYRKKLPKYFFLFIGYFRYYKGLQIALNAVKDTDINLVLAGDGEIKKYLLRKMNKENIKNVMILDQVTEEEKVSLLNLCKGFIFPSHLRSEAFGISLLEAAFFGKPLISCDIGTGTSFVNVHNLTGLVVKPNSPIQLRNAMRYILDHKEVAEKMGEEAKIRARKIFNLQNAVESYKKVYKNLLSIHK